MDYKTVSHTVRSIVEDVLFPLRRTLDYDEARRTGMHLVVGIDVDNYGYEKDANTHHSEWERHFRTYVHIIVVLPHRVYVALSDSGYLKDVRPDEFKNIGNHDSCWHSDDFTMGDIVFKGYHECYDHVPREHCPIPLAANIDVRLSPLVFSEQVFTFVEVTRKNLPQDKSNGWNYFDALESIKVKPYRIAFDVPANTDVGT
jgi:hypothetical protein